MSRLIACACVLARAIFKPTLACLTLESESYLKVLHIIVDLDVGGAELMLKRLIEHSHRESVRHSVISLKGVGTIGRQLRGIGIDVIALDMRSVWEVPSIIFRLYKIIRNARPDVVQTWMYHADLLGGIAARLAGRSKVIWGIRTTDVAAGGTVATSQVRKLCALLSGVVPHRIVCAANASCKAHVAVGYDATRMVVVPNGFDVEKLQADPADAEALRAECGFTREHLVVGVLGRFNPAKDHRNFVQAAGRIAQRHPHVRFLMIGRGLDHSNAVLSSWIMETGVPERFVLLAERTDVPICLSAMDIFCLSSKTEGFPNVVGEAMGMRLPCVVTNVGDAAFLLGGLGVVVPPGDSVALAEGVSRIVEMPASERRLLGSRAQSRIHDEFTMNNARSKFEEIYRSVLGESGR